MDNDGTSIIRNYQGHILLRDLYTQGGLLLIQAGTILDERLLQLAVHHGCELHPVDVRPATFAEEELKCRREIEQATDQVHAYFDEIRLNQKVPLREIRRDVLPHLTQAAEHPHLYGLLSTLQAKDDYTYRHNIGVGVLAALLGKWLGLSDEEVSALTLAATLHDIGKMRIPLEVLNKPGKLTKDEFALIKRHPLYGYEMLLKTSGSTEREKLVALQHHEREDGSGYPYGIRGDQIDYYSKIVAVCDVYHAMSSRRSYHEPSPFYAILDQMEQNKFGEFDAHIVSVFIDRMMGLMVGNSVKLSDGTEGRILLVHSTDPLRPLVQVNEAFIDLREIPELKIEQVIV